MTNFRGISIIFFEVKYEGSPLVPRIQKRPFLHFLAEPPQRTCKSLKFASAHYRVWKQMKTTTEDLWPKQFNTNEQQNQPDSSTRDKSVCPAFFVLRHGERKQHARISIPFDFLCCILMAPCRSAFVKPSPICHEVGHLRSKGSKAIKSAGQTTLSFGWPQRDTIILTPFYLHSDILIVDFPQARQENDWPWKVNQKIRVECDTRKSEHTRGWKRKLSSFLTCKHFWCFRPCFEKLAIFFIFHPGTDADVLMPWPKNINLFCDQLVQAFSAVDPFPKV